MIDKDLFMSMCEFSYDYKIDIFSKDFNYFQQRGFIELKNFYNLKTSYNPSYYYLPLKGGDITKMSKLENKLWQAASEWTMMTNNEEGTIMILCKKK